MASLPEICHFASLRGFVADDSAGSGGTGKSLVLQIHMPIGDSDGRFSAGRSESGDSRRYGRTLSMESRDPGRSGALIYFGI